MYLNIVKEEIRDQRGEKRDSMDSRLRVQLFQCRFGKDKGEQKSAPRI